MIEFKDITINDIDYFNKFLKLHPLRSSNYSFVNLYMWRSFSGVKYAEIKNALILLNNEIGENTFFCQPIGYDISSLREIINAMLEIKKEYNMDCFIKDADSEFADDLEFIYPGRFTIQEDRDCADYIYESRALAALSDKRLRKKRNRYNSFIKSYNYNVKNITSDISKDCIKFSEIWFDENASLVNFTDCLEYENEGIHDVLLNFDRLGVQGIAVYVNDIISAFTIGEKVSDDMAIIHVEKADHDINGLYSFINKTFVEMYYKDVKYINREEDLGLEGLRRAKLSYQPCAIEMRYIISCEL